jgi:hypothetical protein
VADFLVSSDRFIDAASRLKGFAVNPPIGAASRRSAPAPSDIDGDDQRRRVVAPSMSAKAGSNAAVHLTS